MGRGMMLSKNLLGALLSCIAITGFACDNPPLVQIPAASDIGDEGPRIRRETQVYVDAIAEYVACLQTELEAAGGDDAPPLYKAMIVTRNNAAVAEAEAIMELFENRFGTTNSN